MYAHPAYSVFIIRTGLGSMLTFMQDIRQNNGFDISDSSGLY